MESIISIFITSFNREQGLKRTIDALTKQDISAVRQIVVLDNCSSFNVSELIESYNNPKLRLIRNAYNIGMATNIVMPLLKCETEWVWTLSDDDRVTGEAVRLVCEAVAGAASNVGLIKFSRVNHPNSPMDICSLEQLVQYYERSEYCRGGDLVFIATNVFNKDRLSGFTHLAFEHSYTLFGYLVPILCALSQSQASIRFSKEQIVDYCPPVGDGWDPIERSLGLSSISHVRITENKETWKRLLRLLTLVSYRSIAYSVLIDNSERKRMILSVVYYNLYRIYFKTHEKLFHHAFLLFSSSAVLRRLALSSRFLKALSKVVIH